MFLKCKTVVVILLTILSGSVHARQSILLEAGEYQLVSGEKHLCRNFTLSQKETLGKYITIADQYGFEVGKSHHVIESDIDPQCEFREENRLENTANETLLVRLNQEYCRAKLRSSTRSEVRIQTQRIELRHEIDGASYTCVWEKQAQ